MRSVTEGIHRISLANNELKSLTGRFINTFSQLRGKGQPQPLPDPWHPSKTPRLLQRGHSTGTFPHRRFCSSADTPYSKHPYASPFFFTFCRMGALVLLSPTLPNSCLITSSHFQLLQDPSSPSGSLQGWGW